MTQLMTMQMTMQTMTQMATQVWRRNLSEVSALHVYGGLCSSRWQPGNRCQETSMRDTAYKFSLKLCASIVLLFSDGYSEWYVSVVFLTGQVLGNWIA
jgi:hypothetical protein